MSIKLFGAQIEKSQEPNYLFKQNENIIEPLYQFKLLDKPFYITISIFNDFEDVGEENYIYLSLMFEAIILNKGYTCWFHRDINRNTAYKCRDENPDLRIKPICIDELPSQFPRTLEEKLMRVVKLFCNQSSYGNDIPKLILDNPEFTFSKNKIEADYIFQALTYENYITNVTINKNAKGEIIPKWVQSKLTFKAWKLIEQDLPVHKSAFVAMWFGTTKISDNNYDTTMVESMNLAWQAIEAACKELDIKTTRIDRKEHNNQIVDEIFYEIRHSGFMIADFTGQRGGVYFEAGYAKGLGKEVIWTCKDDHFKDIHFDTAQYNFIRWKDAADLGEKLKNRIKAMILP